MCISILFILIDYIFYEETQSEINQNIDETKDFKTILYILANLVVILPIFINFFYEKVLKYEM